MGDGAGELGHKWGVDKADCVVVVTVAVAVSVVVVVVVGVCLRTTRTEKGG